jgi:GNAT superfamily N-acetyltransferase
MCTLFLDDDVDGRRVALLEEVGTLVDYRRRGLARGVVSAAIAAAVAWDAGLIVVPADADDWPQVMYAGLGFAPVGQQVSVTRRDDSSGAGL